MGKIARIDELLKGYQSDKRERLAMALFWVDQFGLDVTEWQTGGRVRWWLTTLDDEDHSYIDDGGSQRREPGRNHYRLMADVAMDLCK